MTKLFRDEYLLFIGILTVCFFKLGGDQMLSASGFSVGSVVAILGLFGVVMATIFAVVRHSDALAIKLGDPLGTLILTLSVVLLEVVMISSVMLTGEPNPVLARDTMFAVVMAVLNGLVGISLLVGGWKFHTQEYNKEGIKSYLVGIIPLALLCLVLPNFTSPEGTGSITPTLTWTLIISSVVLYAVFLFTQTKSHTHFFVNDEHESAHEDHGPLGSNLFHSLMLVGYLTIIILLAKSLAIPINDGIHSFGAPAALGGLIVALLVLAPEGVGGIKAVMKNQVQRAMNLFFGSVLATIALTVPAVLLISIYLAEPITLGLSPTDMVLLFATLMVTSVSFASGRSNVLMGATHLILFFAYVVLMFD
ncbi:calcium:proton antiporter [Corallincola luteus]|uniref:Calcium:proton antiporter n=1 Tax=Corallincola luteus TaxID=1775177 RepID=A0ABY2ALN7_9GAMM|nr:calcium:proton antiporter [Corallincola luteus]TCI02425.1 calcium:proton antiporter [Corallincola luteus]